MYQAVRAPKAGHPLSATALSGQPCTCRSFTSRRPGTSTLTVGLMQACPVQSVVLQHQSDLRARQRRTVLVKADSTPSGRDIASSASGQQEKAAAKMPKEGLISRLLRPLKDFGFGTKSFWEGGVGMFIFAGIGKPRLPYSPAEWLRTHAGGFLALSATQRCNYRA